MSTPSCNSSRQHALPGNRDRRQAGVQLRTHSTPLFSRGASVPIR
jgi:hypothetical protein